MRLKFLFSVSVLALAGMMPTLAQAGFEFVPSNNSAPPISSFSAPSEPMVAPVVKVEAAPLPEIAPPVIKSEPMALTPVKGAIPLTPIAHDSDALVIETKAPQKIPAPVAKPQEFKAGDVRPLTPPPGVMPVAQELPPIDAPSSKSANDDGADLQGFGRDVPLALALQQIVPSNYRYSFDRGINPGMRISWSGGQSWKNVIMDIARSNGMNVDIVSNVVAFHRPNPMDIVSSGISNDAPHDVVMGIPLKPVTEAKPASSEYPYDVAMPSPIQSSGLGDTKPMALVPALQPENRISAPPVMAAEIPAPVVHDVAPIAAPVKVAEAKIDPKNIEKKEVVQFDTLLDDKPAVATVKDKKIVTEDKQKIQLAKAREAAAAPMPLVKMDKAPVVLPPVGMENVDLPPPPVATVEPAAPLMPAPIAAMMTSEEKPIQIATDLVSKQEWEARKGSTLRQTLTAWSERAGVSLVWSSEYDYPLQTDLRMDSGYADAVRTLLAGFSKAQPRPLGRLFKNAQVGAQPVLIVETQRLSN